MSEYVKNFIVKSPDTGESVEYKLYDDEALHEDNIANNLTTTDEGYVLDARQGKALGDRVTELESDVDDIFETLESIDNTIATIENNISDLQSAVTANTTNITTLTSDLADLDEEVDEILPTVETMISEALENITGFNYEIVSALPSEGEKGVIYLVPRSNTEDLNVYDEYIWLDSTSSFERIGSTDIDLSDYVTTEDLNDYLADIVVSELNVSVSVDSITEEELEEMWEAS